MVEKRVSFREKDYMFDIGADNVRVEHKGMPVASGRIWNDEGVDRVSFGRLSEGHKENKREIYHTIFKELLENTNAPLVFVNLEKPTEHKDLLEEFAREYGFMGGPTLYRKAP
jgi:hypothetical protein